MQSISAAKLCWIDLSQLLLHFLYLFTLYPTQYILVNIKVPVDCILEELLLLDGPLNYALLLLFLITWETESESVLHHILPFEYVTFSVHTLFNDKNSRTPFMTNFYFTASLQQKFYALFIVLSKSIP